MSGNAAEANAISPVLQFRVQGTRFCAALGAVERILPLAYLHRVPGAADYLQGVMNLGGECLPVIDLALRLGLAEPAPYTLDTPLLLCRSGGHRGALVVDEVLGVNDVEPADSQLTGMFEGGIPAFVAVVMGRTGPALQLDLARVLAVDLSRLQSELELDPALLEACREGSTTAPHPTQA